MAAASRYRLGVVYTRGMPVFGFERVCIGVEGKAGMRRSSRTTASISNAAVRVKAIGEFVDRDPFIHPNIIINDFMVLMIFHARF